MKKNFFLLLSFIFNFNLIFCAEPNDERNFFKSISKCMMETFFSKKSENRAQNDVINKINQYLSLKYDINISYDNNGTLLHIASILGLEYVVCHLIKCGADVEARDTSNKPVLYVCLDEPKIVRVLLDAGANPLAEINSKTIVDICSEKIKKLEEEVKLYNGNDSFAQSLSSELLKHKKTLGILTRQNV